MGFRPVLVKPGTNFIIFVGQVRGGDRTKNGGRLTTIGMTDIRIARADFPAPSGVGTRGRDIASCEVTALVNPGTDFLFV